MDFAFRSRRRGGFAVAAVIGVAAVLGPASALAAHNVIEPISVAPDGAIGNDSSVAGDHLGDYGDMTPDGRFVVFASAASNLVPGDTNGVGDVFVRDRLTGVTELMSIGPRGVQGDGDSNFLGISTAPAISDDGRYVAFKSDASNLVRGDRNGLTDVFVRDLSGPSPTTERVSVSSDEQPAGEFDTSRNPAIAGDGRFVAFQSNAQNFTPVAQTGFFSDVFVRDREAGTTVLASPDGAGGEASGQSEDPEISADGRFVAFASFASDLIAGAPDPDGGLVRDAFVRDLTSQSTEMISVNGAHPAPPPPPPPAPKPGPPPPPPRPVFPTPPGRPCPWGARRGLASAGAES